MNLNHSDLPMEEASVPKTEAVPELEDMISNPNQATALDPVQTDSESVAITDPVPGQLTFNAGTILLNGTVTGGTCNADGTAGGSYAAPNVSGTIATIAAGATRTLVFRATVN